MSAEGLIDAAERTCARCGYDLRATADPRCPECGLDFDLNALPAPAVPWLRRKQIGFLQAYFETVILVIGHPHMFARQAWRWTEFDPKDGENFRTTTVVIATLSLTGAAAAIALTDATDADQVVAAAIPCIGAIPATVIFMCIATMRLWIEMPRRTRPDIGMRFALLQHFCCAGWGLTPLIAAVAVMGAVCDRMHLVNQGICSLLLIVTTAAVLLLALGGCAMHAFFGDEANAKRFFNAVGGTIGLWLLAGLVAGSVELIVFALLGRNLI